MKHLGHQEINALNKLFRINLINSISGYKSANLIGTRSADGLDNLAIFSSVTHYGSSPPILGMVVRPTSVPRHTYDNIKATGKYTINHVHRDFIRKAHHTSAKYDRYNSEFDRALLTPQFKDGFVAPYVEESPIQIGLEFIEEHHIKVNQTILVLGEIKHVYIDERLLHEDGFVNLAQGGIVSINGLDGYTENRLLERFEYARPNQQTTIHGT